MAETVPPLPGTRLPPGTITNPGNPNQLINAQKRFNRFNQSLPGGSLKFNPTTGAMKLGLSPGLQGLFNQGIGLDKRSGQAFNQALKAFTPGGTLDPNSFSRDARRVENKTFKRLSNLLNPEFDRQEEALTQSLANRGLPSGGEAFDDEFSQFRQSRNESMLAAALDAVGAGRQEHSRLSGLDLQNQQLQGNQLQQLRGLQNTQIPGVNDFFAPGAIDVTGPAQLSILDQNNNLNRSANNTSNFYSGLFGLGAAGINSGLFDFLGR